MRALRSLTLFALSLSAFGAHGDPLFESWKPLGPSLINNGQSGQSNRVPVTGRMTAIALNPQNPLGDIWIGSATGGVWHGAIHPEVGWEPMTDEQPALSVGALALDSCTAVRCATVWVGTGENAIRRDSQYGLGILKGSWNAATHAYDWQQLGADHFSFGNLTRLLLDPTTADGGSKVLYAALSSGITANSTQSTVTTKPLGAYGIWKSLDGGASWALKLGLDSPASDLEMDPVDAKILYAGIRHQGMFRSQDGGDSWQEIGTEIPEAVRRGDWPELAVYRKPGMDAAILYAVLGTCESPHKKFHPIGCSPPVYRSNDGGSSWSEVYAAKDASGLSYLAPILTYSSYNHLLTIHPNDPETVWYGGTQLFRSTDGGTTFSTLAPWALHPDHHQLVLLEFPLSSTGLLAFDLNDGGLFVGNGEFKWSGELQQGLAVTQFQSLDATSWADFLFGGTQDNGGVLFQGTDVWEHNDDGDAAASLIDRDDFETLYDVYVGSPPERCLLPAACGFNFTPIGNGLPDTEADLDPNVSWYPPLLQVQPAPGLDHLLYFGTIDLFWSNDDGSSWNKFTPASPLGGTQTFPELGGAMNPVTAIAVAPSNTSRLYVGFYDGQVWTYFWPTHEWTEISGNLPERPVTSLAVHPEHDNEVFASFAGPGSHSLYRRTKGGLWNAFDASQDGSLATGSTNQVVFEPVSPYRMWAATDFGAYLRESPEVAGTPWRKTKGLPNVAVYEIRITEDAGAVYAATHGRGVWVYDGDPNIDFYEEACCGTIDLYDPAPFEAITAYAFEPNQACTLALYEGTRLCSETSTDALGGVLKTNSRGFLRAEASGQPARNVAWACSGGVCAGGVPQARCAADRAELRCGAQAVSKALRRSEEVREPASTALSLELAPRGGSFLLSPMIARGGGASRSLCSVAVSYTAGEELATVLGRAADAVGRDALCAEAGLRAEVSGLLPAAPRREDEGPEPLALRLTAPGQVGLQLVTEISTLGAGKAVVDGFGSVVRGTRVVPRVTFGGRAAGGEVALTQRSPLGLCTHKVATARGESAEAVAARLAEAFAGRGGIAPLPYEPGCHGGANPRSLLRRGASLFGGLSQGLTVESTDPGLEVTLGASR